ncbi:phosphatase PAP2 family protein [Thermosulfurimonas marina]|uniref:Phosphatase PAP2 family protein n=1 Tax=Thermosulfurimonas marina TaxID=2047767 RepID=A0A6H1WQR8_9BACT|nr:phosphatase PAP2 family protein [Thermosulfurimonas marina]QJA05486.1 phosphatase PAP2 family protein [Thermosulfurimonas marina]
MKALFFLLNQDLGPVVDRLMIGVSEPRVIYAFFILLSLGLLWHRGRRVLAVPFLALALVLLADAFCARVLKPAFHFPRPYAALSGVRVYKGGHFRRTERALSAESYGFPSCHATNTAAATAFFGMVEPWTLLAAAPFTLLVGISRVYLGHHFPRDVLFGWLVGGTVGLSGGWLWRRAKRAS